MFKVTPEIREKITKDIESVNIDARKHITYADGHCVMEVVANVGSCHLPQNYAFALRHEHTDSPFHADRTLTGIMININDSVDGDNRQMLKALVPWLVGSNAGHQVAWTRGTMLMKAFITRVAQLNKGTDICRELCPIGQLVLDGKHPEAKRAINEVANKYAITDVPWATFDSLSVLSKAIGDYGPDYTYLHRLICDDSRDKEAENLQFFIDTVIDIIKATEPEMA